MNELPKSLTAVIHVKFHYTEPETTGERAQAEMISKIIEEASDLSPELQEILAKFAEYLNRISQKGKTQSPG